MYSSGMTNTNSQTEEQWQTSYVNHMEDELNEWFEEVYEISDHEYDYTDAIMNGELQ